MNQSDSKKDHNSGGDSHTSFVPIRCSHDDAIDMVNAQLVAALNADGRLISTIAQILTERDCVPCCYAHITNVAFEITEIIGMTANTLQLPEKVFAETLEDYRAYSTHHAEFMAIELLENALFNYRSKTKCFRDAWNHILLQNFTYQLRAVGSPSPVALLSFDDGSRRIFHMDDWEIWSYGVCKLFRVIMNEILYSFPDSKKPIERWIKVVQRQHTFQYKHEKMHEAER